MSEKEIKKLTSDEITSVKSLRDEIVKVISDTGQLKLTHDMLDDDLSIVKSKLEEQKNKYRELLEKEKQIIDTFIEKYGIGSLDVETGVFTPENK